MSKPNHSKNSSTKALEKTTKTLEKATKDWRSAKKRERAARNALAAIVNEAVGSGVMSENKVASITAIPRMTIRKMLGKDDLPAEAAATDEPTVDAPSFVAVSVVEEAQTIEPDSVVTDEPTADDAVTDETDADDAVTDETDADDAVTDETDAGKADGSDAGVQPLAFARPVTPTWASPPSSTFTT
jgi:hypothetical protein